MNVFQAISAYGGFDHKLCNELIFQRRIFFASLLRGFGNTPDYGHGLLLNYVFVAGAAAFGLFTTVAAFFPALHLNREVPGTKPGPHSILGDPVSQRWIGPLVLAAAIAAGVANSEEFVRYVTTCRILDR